MASGWIDLVYIKNLDENSRRRDPRSIRVGVHKVCGEGGCSRRVWSSAPQPGSAHALPCAPLPLGSS